MCCCVVKKLFEEQKPLLLNLYPPLLTKLESVTTEKHSITNCGQQCLIHTNKGTDTNTDTDTKTTANTDTHTVLDTGW